MCKKHGAQEKEEVKEIQDTILIKGNIFELLIYKKKKIKLN